MYLCVLRELSKQTAIISIYSITSDFTTEKTLVVNMHGENNIEKTCLLCGTNLIFKYNSGNPSLWRDNAERDGGKNILNFWIRRVNVRAISYRGLQRHACGPCTGEQKKKLRKTLMTNRNSTEVLHNWNVGVTPCCHGNATMHSVFFPQSHKRHKFRK
jgi:hypothetical protein